MRDERTGLAALLVFFAAIAVIFSFSTNNGQAVSNIFANIVSYVDETPSPTVEAQFAPMLRTEGTYWLIGGLTLIMGLVTLAAILGYALIRRRVARTWSILLLLVGAINASLFLAAIQLQNAIAAVGVPATQFGSKEPSGAATRDSLVGATNALTYMALLGGVLVLIALALLAWSFMRDSRQHSLAGPAAKA